MGKDDLVKLALTSIMSGVIVGLFVLGGMFALPSLHPAWAAGIVTAIVAFIGMQIRKL